MNPSRLTLFNLLEDLGEDAWRQDLKTGETSFTASFWKALGYSPRILPMTREAAQELVHPTDADLAAEEVQIHLEAGEPFELEVRVRAATGEWRFIRVRGCVTDWDDHGDPDVMGGTFKDITEDVQAAVEHRRAEDMVCTLSRRERQVLDCLVAGAANKNIAHALGVSGRTVEGYRARILEKLGVRGVGELVKVALSAGVMPVSALDCGMARSHRAGIPQ